MNKLTIDGTDYELEEAGVGSNLLQPFIIFKGKNFVGKVIPNQPKQKDWEILSFKGIGEKNKGLFLRRDEGFYYHESWENTSIDGVELLVFLNQKPPHNNTIIHSIKRLPDNTIFTIDDKFTADAGQELTIKGFEVEGGIMKVFSKEHGYWYLSDIKKVNQPLFTTADGKTIFEGDFYYFIPIDYSQVFYLEATEGTCADYRKEAAFSTEEAAKEYVNKNFRCFSFTDVVNVMTQSGNDHFPFFPQLYDLAKERVDGK